MLKRLFAFVSLAALLMVAPAVRAAQAPEDLIKQVSTEVLDAIRGDQAIQGGDLGKLSALVDSKVMPNVDFERMTAATVGRHWRQATPDQRKRLQAEFKALLVRTYSGALTQVRNQTVQIKPTRGSADDNEVIVRTEVRGGGGDPIQLDYRLEKVGDGWKIYDVNVLGFWLVEQFRSNFSQELANNGVEGLIGKLAEQRAKSGAAGGAAKKS